MKDAQTNCIHCKKPIQVTTYVASWNEILQTLLFRKARHELEHLANGTDVYSQMERGK